MEYELKRDMVLSNGDLLFSKGTLCKIVWDDKDLPDCCMVSANGKSKLVDTKRLPKYFHNIDLPSDEELEDWVVGGDDTLSVFGNVVDPDGWDSDGSPSWLLALGLM